MHAIQLHAFGPAENLRYEKVPDPEPGPGQVRIAVAAAGVHMIDTAIRSGAQGPVPLPELPTVPGREVAGTVDQIGPDVDTTWLGKQVVAHLGNVPGGYAEFAVTEAARLQEIPENIDPAAAVAVIGTGRTTMGILQFAELGPGSVAVVTAAAGGIGTLLVQYARNAGATVVGLAGGPAKVDLVQRNGADIAVDYTQSDWVAQVRALLGDRSATILFDSVGGEITRAAVDLLGKGDSISSTAGPAESPVTSRSRSARRSWPSVASVRKWSSDHRCCRESAAPSASSKTAPSPRPPRAACARPSSASRSPTPRRPTAHCKPAPPSAK